MTATHGTQGAASVNCECACPACRIGERPCFGIYCTHVVIQFIPGWEDGKQNRTMP